MCLFFSGSDDYKYGNLPAPKPRKFSSLCFLSATKIISKSEVSIFRFSQFYIVVRNSFNNDHVFQRLPSIPAFTVFSRPYPSVEWFCAGCLFPCACVLSFFCFAFSDWFLTLLRLALWMFLLHFYCIECRRIIVEFTKKFFLKDYIPEAPARRTYGKQQAVWLKLVMYEADLYYDLRLKLFSTFLVFQWRICLLFISQVETTSMASHLNPDHVSKAPTHSAQSSP